ncbi:cytochrome c, partial [Pseudomonas aeruginosa]|nr:cytochrome c [Pseudomonas aeruginosa]
MLLTLLATLGASAHGADEMRDLLPICSSCHGADGHGVAPSVPKQGG